MHLRPAGFSLAGGVPLNPEALRGWQPLVEEAPCRRPVKIALPCDGVPR
jgi:hypothetical protein